MAFILWVLTALLPGDQTLPKSPAVPATAISRAGWLVGCWRSTAKGTPDTFETWTRASDDLLVATATTTKPGFPPEFGFFRIESGAGAITFVSQPAGTVPLRLLLDRDTADGELVFYGADGQHGARRIGYTRGKNQTMTVTTASGDGAKRSTAMKRVDCR